jgi:hypothetical protein
LASWRKERKPEDGCVRRPKADGEKGGWHLQSKAELGDVWLGREREGEERGRREGTKQ